MKKMMVSLLLMVNSIAFAAGDLTTQDPIEVKVQLGNEKDEMVFIPDNLEFETGKLYKLTITNGAPQAHYFISDALAKSVFTRKVEVYAKDEKKYAEIKGVISEIELFPGGKAIWFFVPIKAGKFTDSRCSIKGHEMMKGSITIK